MIRMITCALLLTLASVAVMENVARADSVAVNVTGKVLAAACTVDNNGKYDIDLGQNLSTVRLNSTTPYTEWKSFNVTLSQCPAATTKVTARFSGMESSARSDLYANATGDGYARNMGVELQRATGGINAGNGKSLVVDVDTLRRATFDLQARVYGTGNATPGRISSVVTLDLTYN